MLCRAGDCFARLGRLDHAEALFCQALVPGYDRSALLGLARVHTLRGEHAEATLCHEIILARNPEDARTRQLLTQGRAILSPVFPPSDPDVMARG